MVSEKPTHHAHLVESSKLFYDLFKHVTTLTTGTIVVLATFLEKLFKAPLWLPLVVITFVGLVLSLIASLGAMAFFAKHVREEVTEAEGNIATAFIVVCLVSFLIAIACLTAFTVRNFMA